MGLEERTHCRTATMLPWTDSPGCASWRPAWDSPPASPPISEKVEQAVCPPGIRAERIRADIGFEAASPFPAAGGISLPCLRLPPPRVSGQGGSVPAIPCNPPESSFRPLGSLSNLFDEPDILQKSAREYAGSFVLSPLYYFTGCGMIQ